MGHNRLGGSLPDTAPWRRVVGVLTEGGDVAAVATTTSQAAQVGLDLAKEDEGLKHTFWLLSEVVLAARQDDFRAALKDIGVVVPNEPTALNVVAGITDAIDNHLRKTHSRTSPATTSSSRSTRSRRPRQPIFTGEQTKRRR